MSGHVYLIGFMGSGKSTVGAILSERLGLPLIDMDERVQRESGMTIAEIFALDGERRFRQLESAVLTAAAAESPSVVACGGGVVLDPINRRRLCATGIVVYLHTTPEETRRRISDVASRPLLAQGTEGVAELFVVREALYEEIADITVETVGAAPEDVAEQIVEAIGSRDG